jgi:hypothetical protein
MFSLIALLQCLVSLKGGQSSTERSIRIVVSGVVGEPFFDFGDHRDDFDVRGVLPGHEQNTM